MAATKGHAQGPTYSDELLVAIARDQIADYGCCMIDAAENLADETGRSYSEIESILLRAGL